MRETVPPVSGEVRPHSTFASGRQKLLAHLAMIGFASFVAGSFSVGALAAPYVGPTALNAMRFVFGTAIMGAIALFLLRGRIPRPGAEWRFLVLGGLMAVFFVTMFIALRLTDPVSSGAVFTTMPIMSAFFGWLFLGQIPGRTVMLSLAIAGCGAVWVVFGGDLDALLSFDIGRGELIFLIGVACHAAYAPLVRRLNRGEPVIAFTFFTLAGHRLDRPARDRLDLDRLPRRIHHRRHVLPAAIRDHAPPGREGAGLWLPDADDGDPLRGPSRPRLGERQRGGRRGRDRCRARRSHRRARRLIPVSSARRWPDRERLPWQMR
jgi:uncharacterized membrane protein